MGHIEDSYGLGEVSVGLPLLRPSLSALYPSGLWTMSHFGGFARANTAI